MIQKIVSQLNESKRMKENSSKLLDIQNQLEDGEVTGELVSTLLTLFFFCFKKLEIFGKGRIFHFEGMLALSEVADPKKSTKFKDTMCFLFNDILLVTMKKKSGKYEAMYQIPLELVVLNAFNKIGEKLLNFLFHLIIILAISRKHQGNLLRKLISNHCSWATGQTFPLLCSNTSRQRSLDSKIGTSASRASNSTQTS